MKITYKGTPDEIEYLVRMLMDILRNQPNKAKILR